MRKVAAFGTLTGLVFAATIAIGAPPSSADVSSPVVKCRSVSGAVAVSPGLSAAPRPQTVQLDGVHVSRCRATDLATSADISGTLQSAAASCPLAPDQRFHGSLDFTWSNAMVSYVQSARLRSMNNADDPFEVRLRGLITGGANTGATLRARLHLAPTQGDCSSAVTNFSISNVKALSIGGPYANCSAVSGSASVTPGLSTTAQSQTIHLETLYVSGCHAGSTASTAEVIGALQADSASCPVAAGERFRGSIEIDWANHFVSVVPHVRLDSTNNPADPYEMRMHGLVKRGADAGAILEVVLHVAPAQGDCASGVTEVAITNVTAFTIE